MNQSYEEQLAERIRYNEIQDIKRRVMDEDYEKDCYEKDYEEYRGNDYRDDDEYDETDERVEIEFTARNIYNILESVAYYHYVSRERYSKCCCGSFRQEGRIICNFCADIRDKMDDIDRIARERMYDQMVEWIKQKQDYSFRRFFSVCFKDIGIFVKDNRKIEAVEQLVRCLREIERMKLVESHYVDDLIQSIAQRWNILEIS